MNLNDFFETNNVTLEISEIYSGEKAEGKSKKTALNAARRELSEAYAGEDEMLIQLQMGLYWYALQKGFVDEKSKNRLDALTSEMILSIYGESNGRLVNEVLAELLKVEPVKQVRQKIDYSNPGSNNWKPGDIYAYQIFGEEARTAGIEGKYTLIYVIEKEVRTRLASDIICYLLLKLTDGLEGTVEQVIDESVFLPFGRSLEYRCLLSNKNYEYPTNRIIYVGNIYPLRTPERELLPLSKLHCWWIRWEGIEWRVAAKYEVYKKIFPK